MRGGAEAYGAQEDGQSLASGPQLLQSRKSGSCGVPRRPATGHALAAPRRLRPGVRRPRTAPPPPPHCPRLALAGRVGRDLGWPGATAECLAPRPTLCLSPPPTRPGCTKKLHRDPRSHLAPLPPPPAAPRGADLSRARRGAGSLSGAGPGAGPGGGASGSADPKPAAVSDRPHRGGGARCRAEAPGTGSRSGGGCRGGDLGGGAQGP